MPKRSRKRRKIPTDERRMVQELKQQVAALERIVEDLRAEVNVMQKSPLDKAFDIAIKVAIPVVIGIVGWVYAIESETDRIASRIEVVEQTRFTDKDGNRLLETLHNEIRTNYPPRWLSDAVVRIEAATQANAARFIELSERIIRLESSISGIQTTSKKEDK